MAKRLEKELERLFAALPPSIESITLREGDNKAWTVVFLGPVRAPLPLVARSLARSCACRLRTLCVPHAGWRSVLCSALPRA